MFDEHEPLRVCLERSVELEGARLRLRDWPGFGQPLVHVGDALRPSETVVEALARALAPRHRVLGLSLRRDTAHQTQAADVLGVLDQFGFVGPVLVGEGLGCLAALLVAAWHPGSAGGLVLIDAVYEVPAVHDDSLEARALRDCPPQVASLRMAVRCPRLELAWNDASLERLRQFLHEA